MTEMDSNIQVDVPIVKKKFSFKQWVANLFAFALVHKLALGIAGGVIGLFLLTTLGAVAVSSQPGFCISCHEINPAYGQWLTSSHYGITCINCHSNPGLGSYIKVNTTGVLHLITHSISDYQVPSEADVNAASCLSCHPIDTLPESSLRTTLRMAHSKHVQQVECSDCHGRLVHVSTVAEVSTAPKPHEVRDCTVCHTPDNCPHGDATLACTSCHSGNIPQHNAPLVRGVMPRQSCQECHAKNKVGSPEYCQTCHISPHGISVPCSRCHTSNTTWAEHTFNHPVALTGKHANLDCAKCHANKVLAQMKFVCSECHTPPRPHSGTINGTTGDCTNCHTPDGWKPAKGIKAQPADHTGRTTCLACHTLLPQPKLPDDHKGRADAICATCHKAPSQ